jgi:hypothetical protein
LPPPTKLLVPLVFVFIDRPLVPAVDEFEPVVFPPLT